MKHLTTLILSLAFLTGCTFSTPHGKCIGIQEVEKPDLEYRFDATNIIVAILFIETAIVPVFVALDHAKCPVGPKGGGG